MITLYKKTATGAIQLWQIGFVQPNEIVILYGQLNGSMQEQRETVPKGLASRTLKEQIKSRIKSRVSKQIDKGYVRSLEEAVSNLVTNAMGLPKPMLAMAMKRISSPINMGGAKVQLKYDGHRCLIGNIEGEIVAYSRNGKPIDSISHIIQGLNIPEGVIIDGELYHHGTPLQTIASWVKRKQDNTEKLTYQVYDMISANRYEDRLNYLLDMDLGDNAGVISTWDHSDPNAPTLRESIAEGYEGLIVRLDGTGYQDGKRNKSLIKIKEIYDDEFLVTNITESRDGWAILHMVTSEGKAFRASAPGTMGNKKIILEQKDQHIGKMIRLEYSDLTKDNIPFHPVALEFRDKSTE